MFKDSVASPCSSIKELLESVDYVCAAIEIVDSRIANWDIRLADTIADNASSGLFVLGEHQVNPDLVDWIGCHMSMSSGGEVVSDGTGVECMGDPRLAALWLVQKMNELGRPIGAGDCVLSGALGPMVAAKAGDAFACDIQTVGKVSVKFD